MIDSMMDLWWDVLGQAAPLATPSQPASEMVVKSPGCWPLVEDPNEDSGYSTCLSSSSVESCPPPRFKTPCCPSERPSSIALWPRSSSAKSRHGLKHLDLLVALSEVDVLDEVLVYLEPDDVVRCCLVSKEWNAILGGNRLSRRKRVVFAATRTLSEKENLTRPGELTLEKSLKRVRPTASSTPLATITASRQLNFSTPISSSPQSPSKVRKVDRFNLYRQAGSSLREGEAQMSCPRCTLPARRDVSVNLGQCGNGLCRFQFCLSCHGEHHTKSSCLLLRSPEKMNKSRKLTVRGYRRNMRRL